MATLYILWIMSVNGLKVIIFIEDIYIYYIYIFMYTLLFIILNYSEGASPDVIE